MKKLLLVLTMILCLIVTTGNAPIKGQNNGKISIFVSSEIDEDITKRISEEEAFEKQGYLLECFSEIKNELSEDIYGGSYFDDDGDLHIQICEVDNELPCYPGIVYEKVKYSFKQLTEFQDIVIEKHEQIGFDSSGIRQNLNKIILYSQIDVNKELVERIIPEDAYMVVHDNVENVNCTSVNVIPGKKITNTSNNTYGSISCGVVWDNSTSNKKWGFMTAGHLGSVGDSVKYLENPMGTITAKQESGSVDAALILRGQNQTTFNITNTVYDGKSYAYNGGTFPQNTSIYAYGATSTYINNLVMTGSITDVSYSGTFAGIYFTNLIKTNATCVGGDSGGPVLTAYSDGYAIIGIIKGTSNGDMVYVNMDNIKNAFDLNVASS